MVPPLNEVKIMKFLSERGDAALNSGQCGDESVRSIVNAMLRSKVQERSRASELLLEMQAKGLHRPRPR